MKNEEESKKSHRPMKKVEKKLPSQAAVVMCQLALKR